MKATLAVLCICLAAVLLLSCNDSSPSYPVGDGGWYLTLDVGRIPSTIEEYPYFVTMEAETINLTSGGRPADGTILVFSSSDGTFQNGLSEIDLGMVDGKAETDLRIDHPGRYEITVEFPRESLSVSSAINIGLTNS